MIAIDDKDVPTIASDFRYAAFISYRHTEPDRALAKWLHGALETYHIPARVREPGRPPRIGRVFRDEEELPASADLNREIETALAQSRFLIVVCSPRTPQSLWVNKEVLRFREMGRHDRILALLIEGEPQDSFPPALREIRRTVADETGMTREEIEQVEPLAADVRASRGESQHHLRRMAQLRMLACILGCRFDDLRQRDQERRLRRQRAVAGMLVGVAILLAGLSVWALKERALAQANEQTATRNAEEARTQRDLAEQRLEAFYTGQAVLELASGDSQRAAPYVMEAFLLADRRRDVQPALRYLVARVARGLLEAGNRHSAKGSTSPTIALAPGQHVVRTHDLGVSTLCFSHDAASACVAGVDRKVGVWNIGNGERTAAFATGNYLVASTCFSRNGQRYVVGGMDATAYLGDVSGKADPLRISEGAYDMVGLPRYGSDGAVFAGDQRILMACGDGAVRGFETETGKLLFTIPAHKARVTSVAADEAGTWGASGGNDGGIAILDLHKMAVRQVFAAHTKPVRVLQFSHDGRLLLSASADGTACLWDMAAGKVRHILRGHGDAINAAVVNEEGSRAITASDDATARIWDLATGSCIAVLQAPSRPAKPGMMVSDPNFQVGAPDGVLWCGFSLDGSLAATGGRDRCVYVWDVTSGQCIDIAGGHERSVVAGTFVPDGMTLVTGDEGGTVRAWEVGANSESLASMVTAIRQQCRWRLEKGRLIAADKQQLPERER
jgi:WD40 repeat protein